MYIRHSCLLVIHFFSYIISISDRIGCNFSTMLESEWNKKNDTIDERMLNCFVVTFHSFPLTLHSTFTCISYKRLRKKYDRYIRAFKADYSWSENLLANLCLCI